MSTALNIDTSRGEGAVAGERARWHALWTRSHCEPLVAEQLLAKGFHPFLPAVEVWSTRAGERHAIRVPLFPGYLFLHDIIDKAAHVEVCRSRGLVGLLGASWDRLAVVPAQEIEAIQRLLIASPAVRPHPYLREGERVRIAHGPLQGIEGFLLRIDAKRGALVVSVHLLQRSVKVEIDCAVVKPA